MAIYKLRYGNEVRVIKNFFSERVATQRLVRDDSGAWFYRSEHSDIRVHAQDYAWLRDLANLEGFDCDDITLEVFTGCQNTRREVFNGIFTPRSVAFNHNRCLATMKPKTNDIYKCLFEGWEKDLNILDIETQVTVKESNPVYSYLGYQFTIEFTITDGNPLNDPQGNGYHPSNVVVIPGGLEVWFRFIFQADCVAGQPPNFESWLTAETCDVNGTSTVVITGDPYDPNATVPVVPDFPESSQFFEAADQTEADNLLDQFPTFQQLQNDASSALILFNSQAEVIQEYSNGRTLEDVLKNLVLNSCEDIDRVQSDLFRINSTSTENILTDLGYPLNYYDGLVLFQTSDILFADADQDASRGLMNLKSLLEDLYRMFRTAWRIIDDNGDKVFLIEHESFFSEPVGNDLSVDAKKYDNVEPLTDTFPLRQTFSALSQYSVDFVGNDIEYNGNCVGTEVEVNAVRNFILDYPYLLSNAEVDPPLDSFVMLHTKEFSQGRFIVIEQGILSGTEMSNIGLSWSFLHRLFHRHEKPLSNFTMNGSNTTALSVAPSKSKSFNTFSGCDNTINFEQLIKISNSHNLRVTAFAEKMLRCRVTIEGEF